MRCLMATFALTLAPVAQALAWGDEGHRIVCEIAFHEASADTRAKIDALIASAGEAGPFSELCIWAGPSPQAGRRALREPGAGRTGDRR